MPKHVRYFEVLAGLKPGDQVVTGPYNSVRGLRDGVVVLHRASTHSDSADDFAIAVAA